VSGGHLTEWRTSPESPSEPILQRVPVAAGPRRFDQRSRLDIWHPTAIHLPFVIQKVPSSRALTVRHGRYAAPSRTKGRDTFAADTTRVESPARPGAMWGHFPTCETTPIGRSDQQRAGLGRPGHVPESMRTPHARRREWVSALLSALEDLGTKVQLEKVSGQIPPGVVRFNSRSSGGSGVSVRVRASRTSSGVFVLSSGPAGLTCH
jgi:hypothetical protein